MARISNEREQQVRHRLQTLNMGDLRVALSVHDVVFEWDIPDAKLDLTATMPRDEIVAWIMDTAGDERFPAFLAALPQKGIVI